MVNVNGKQQADRFKVKVKVKGPGGNDNGADVESREASCMSAAGCKGEKGDLFEVPGSSRLANGSRDWGEGFLDGDGARMD